MAVEHDTSAGGAPATRVTARTARWRRPFVRVLLACLGLHLAWAFAMPVTSAPDEPAHLYRAVSLWDGHLLPTVQHPRDSWLVRVPASVVDYAESTSCSKWRPDVPAGCARPTSDPAGETTVGTAAGRYFPLYYVAVGWPGGLDAGLPGFYGMRAMSALGSSILLALAVVTVLRTVGARWARVALPVAITPQVLWLGSTINPNAWEVGAGVLAWAAGLALVSGASTESRRTLWARFLLGACVLLLMRRLSPLWLVLVLLGLLAVRLCIPAPARPRLQTLATRRAAVAGGGALAGLGALSAWWHLTFDLATVTGYPNDDPAPEGFWPALGVLLPDISRWLEQTYGVFGWLDAPAPDVAMLGWVVLGSALFAVVALGSVHRLRVVVTVAAGMLLCVAVPLAFGLTVGREIGIHFWQGRYTMPFAMGIPLAIAVLGACRRDGPPELTRLLHLASPAAWVAWPCLGTLSFVWALHRYVSGAGGGWSPDAWTWTPPGGVLLLVTVHLAAAAGLAASLRDTPTVGADGPPGPVPPAVAAPVGGVPRAG